jgi:hypothetical protein
MFDISEDNTLRMIKLVFHYTDSVLRIVHFRLPSFQKSHKTR